MAQPVGGGGGDGWDLRLDGVAQRVELAAHLLACIVERQAATLQVELERAHAAQLRLEEHVAVAAGGAWGSPEAVRRSAVIAALCSPERPDPRPHEATPPPRWRSHEPEPEPEPEQPPEQPERQPELVSGSDVEATLYELLRLPPEPPRSPSSLLPDRHRLPRQTTPLSHAATAREAERSILTADARSHRRRRGSPEALAAESRLRKAQGGTVREEAARYRARLEGAALSELSHDGSSSEGWQTEAEAEESRARAATVVRDEALMQWFKDKKLLSVAPTVCDGLGLRTVVDLVAGAKVTPAALTELAARHPELNPLRLRRLKDALVAEAAATRGVEALASVDVATLADGDRSPPAQQQWEQQVADDWAAWSPPPATPSAILFNSSFRSTSSPLTDASRGSGLFGMESGSRSVTTRALQRHQLTRAEENRVVEEERAKLQSGSREWEKRGKQRAKEAREAQLGGTVVEPSRDVRGGDSSGGGGATGGAAYATERGGWSARK